MKQRAEKIVVVNTTVENEKQALALADLIVRSRLAACVQLLPIRSVYRWKGKVERASEYLLLAKTRASLAGKLVLRIKAHHAYDVPEILVTPVLKGHPPYLAWVKAETE